MTDLELLELAANAVGFWNVKYNCYSGPLNWDPLTDDGDALRLAVKLGLVIDCSRPSCGEPFKRHAIWIDELMSNAELTRRAIVRAAADIGKGME